VSRLATWALARFLAAILNLQKPVGWWRLAWVSAILIDDVFEFLNLSFQSLVFLR
jgi:hypothetical protein